MIPKLSIVIPTYNRIDMLKVLIRSIQDKFSGYEYEIIISDDASSDGTKEYFLGCNNNKIVYVRSETNQGAIKNILLGYKQATSDIVWTIADDDNIGESDFILRGVEAIICNKADVVFGRMIVRHASFDEVRNYKFKNNYTSDEFIEEWFNLINHVCFSSFLFKKDSLLDVYPNRDGFFGNTIDYDIIYKIIKKTKNIVFIDKIAYIWTKSSFTSLSGQSRGDLLTNLAHIFAFPLANFLQEKEHDVNFFNKYILSGVDTLISNFYIASSQVYFKKILDWYAVNKIDKLYIYGKGEVGIMLREYLDDNKIGIDFFIDDTVNDEDCIKYDVFLQDKALDAEIGVILASYKCDVILKIKSKIGELKNKNIKIISLHALSRGDDAYA